MIYAYLFKEFFKIGLLSFGGGYATLPFLYHIAEKYNWYTLNELSQMLAIASVTPGPIGINMATYAGIKTHGIIAALLATISIVLPAIFIVIAISKLLKKFSDNFYVKSAIYGLKPASCALIAAVGIRLIKTTIVGVNEIVLLTSLTAILFAKKKSPFFLLLTASLAGYILEIISKIS